MYGSRIVKPRSNASGDFGWTRCKRIGQGRRQVIPKLCAAPVECGADSLAEQVAVKLDVRDIFHRS